MSRMLDPALMRTLLAVAEEGSYTRVGDRLGLTQQAISAQIKRLEAVFGRRLVDRTGQGVTLTGDGEALLAYAKQFAEIDDKVRRHFSAVPFVGSIRVGVLEGFASTGLPSVLAAMRAAQPNLDITLETASTGRLLARMDRGRLDMVLGIQRENGSHGEALWPDQVRWFGDPDPFVDPQTTVRLVLAPEPSLVRAIAVEALTDAGRPYAVLFESESRTSQRAAALAGLGVAPFCGSFHDEGAPADVPNLPAMAPVEFFLRVDRTKGQAVEIFADFVGKFGRGLLEEHPLGRS